MRANVFAFLPTLPRDALTLGQKTKIQKGKVISLNEYNILCFSKNQINFTEAKCYYFFTKFEARMFLNYYCYRGSEV